jgi:MFS family permease
MTPIYRPLARHWFVLCLVSAGWAFSFGLGAPVASLWLEDRGCSDTLVGVNTGIYYLGIALAAGLVPGLLRRYGHIGVAVGIIASGVSVALLPVCSGMGEWMALRFLNGVAGAMSLIPLETYVNRHSPDSQRARNFGFYAFAIALGWALGNLVGLQMYPLLPRIAFVVGGLGALAAGVLLLTSLPWPPEPAASPERGSVALGRHFLGFGSAWSQGFLEGGMVAFMPIYLLFLGLSENKVSLLTSGIMIGVIVFQVPVAWLADRLGRTRVLLGCYVATLVGLGFLPFCGDSVWLAVGLLMTGACSGAFYPLGLAILGEQVPAAELARANAWYLGINCCGSLVGPVLLGMTMDWLGKPAMFHASLGAVFMVLAVWLVIQARNRLGRVRQPGGVTSEIEIGRAA